VSWIPARSQRRPFHDVHARPVVPLHVAIACREPRGLAAAQVARDREGLEEHFGHHHGAPDIEDHTAVVQRGERCGESLEVAVARGTERGAVRRGVLMDDVGPERGVHGDGE